jgi:NAD(P)-dependent dehydrogenase (short-subunit alcohol dehydrogenase family)
MAQTGTLDGKSDQDLDAIRQTIPLRRLAAPVEVAGAYHFLASDMSGLITGSTLDVNGGMHINRSRSWLD